MNSESKSPVTLEQLLRLKRGERPSAEFWTQFERELRAKQLAAIVERRPWWSSLPRIGAALRRHQLSLGTMTAVAVVYLGVREFEIRRGAAPAAAPVAADQTVAMPAPAVAVSPSPAPAVVAPATHPRAALAAFHSPAPGPAPEAAMENLAAPTALAIDDISPGESLERSPGFLPARPMAVDLTADSMMGATRDFTGLSRDDGSRLLSVRSRVIDPLAQMSSPTEERRSRLLAEAEPATATVDSADEASRPSERVVNSLSEDRLFETAHRYEVDADQEAVKVSFKF